MATASPSPTAKPKSNSASGPSTSTGAGNNPIIKWVQYALYLVIFLFILSYFEGCGERKAQKRAEKAKIAAATQPQGEVVVQLPDMVTPCKVTVNKIVDLYTPGVPLLIHPPGWPADKFIYYDGVNPVRARGGNIHRGIYTFYKALDENTPDYSGHVRIRVWAKK